MRIAIISDMHGNDFAFKKVEADIKSQGIDQVVCLGDAIQGGAQPKETVNRLRNMKCPVVMGNADDWLIKGEETGKDPIPEERLKKMQAIREWSLSQLNDEDIKFIKSFQPTITINLEKGLDLLCFHGSPTDYDHIILPTTSEEDFMKYLGNFKKNILAGGHTHTQQIRRCGARFFLNPGSIGFPFSSYQFDRFHVDAWAEYAILNIADRNIGVEFRRLDYDAKDLIDIYKKSGRPFVEDAIAQYQR
ncbi:MAG: metallophosphoesterase family protein [Anaerolineales bacterium]|nr:metallophosphoesterase family protein [Anaerolineales bacterium]